MINLGIFTKNKDHISILINEESLRIAHLRAEASGFQLVNISKRDIRGISEEELPKVIRSVLNDFNVKKASAISVIPSSLTTTKNIEIPSLDPNEIRSIINLQAGRHTPYSREEIIIDYINIGVFQRNYSKVLLLIVNRNAIKKQLSIFEQAGLKIQKAVFVSEAIARFYANILNLPESDPPFGIIDIESSFTDFSIGVKKTVITCRSIPVGMTHISSEGQGAYDRLVAELKKSLDAYQSEDIERLPQTYILTTDNNKVKSLQPILRDTLKANIKIVPYLDNLRVGQNARKAISEFGDESFLDLVAPLLTLNESKINLLPEEVQLQRAIESQGQEVLKTAIFCIIIFVTICLLFYVKLSFKNAFLNNLKTNHDKTREEAQMLSRIAEKTRIIKDHLNNRLVSLDVINELYKIIPDEIYLSNIVLDENGSITIQGTSESMSRVFSLVGALEESSLFKNVKTNSTTAKKERGKDVAAFELTFKLESAKDDTEKGVGADKDKGKEKPAAPEEKKPEKE